MVLLVVVLLAVRKVEVEEGGRGAKEDGGDAADGGRGREGRGREDGGRGARR